jgi:hypothetical protein
MNKIIISVTSLIAVVLSGITYFIGDSNGYFRGQKEISRMMTKPEKYWKELVELDKSLFQWNFQNTKDNLTAGRHTIQCFFPENKNKSIPLYLDFIDSVTISKATAIGNNYFIHDIKQDSNFISFIISSTGEEADQVYVGFLNGNEMGGKVYIPCEFGWHLGPTEIGCWKLFKNR